MAINPYTGKPYKSKKNIPKDRQEEIDEYQFNRARTKELDQIKNQLFNGPNNMFNQQQNKITTSFNAPDLSGMSINDLTSKVKTDLHNQYIKNIVPDESNKYIKRTNWRNDGFSPDVDINRLKQLQQIKPPDNPYQDPRRVSDYDIDNTKNYIKNTYKPPTSSGLMPDTPQYTNTMPNNLNKPNPKYEKFLRERLEARDVEGREGLINITDNPLMKNLYSGILDPLAYEAEKLYKDSWIGRTATQAGQVAGYKMINQDKTPVEKSDQGLIGNISADMVGTILGLMTVKDGGGQSLLNATDDFGRMIGEKVAQKLPTATTKAGAWVNRLAPEVARGAADNAIGDAMVAIGQGKDLKTTAKDTAESAFYGGLFGGITKGADEFIKQRRMDKVINDPNFLYNHNQIGDGTVKPGEAAKGPGTKGPDPEQLSIKGAKDKAKFNPLNDPLKLSKANRMKDRRRMIGGNDVAEDIVTSPGDFDTKYPTVKGHVTPIDDTTVDNEYFEMIPSYRIKRTPKTHEVAQDVQKAPERTNTIPDEDKLLEEQIKTNKSKKVNLERFGECEIIDEDNGQITLKNKKGTEFKIGEAAFEKLKIYDKPAAAPKAADPPQIKPVEIPPVKAEPIKAPVINKEEPKVAVVKEPPPIKPANKTQDEYAKEIKDYYNKVNRKDISRKVGVVLELINNGELSNDYLTKVMDDANGKIENVYISKPATKASKQDKIVIKDLTKRLQRADELYRNLGNAGYFEKDKNATLIEKETKIAEALEKQGKNQVEKLEAEKAERNKKEQELYDKTYKEYEDKIKADIENGMEFGKLVDKYADDEIEGLDVEGSHFVITIGNKLYEAKEAKEKGLTVEEYRKQYEDKQAKESKETEEFLKNQAYESAIKHTKHSQATIDNALERISEGKKLLKETLEELEINRNGLNYQIKEGGAKYRISGTDKETDLKKFTNEEIAKMKELAEKSNDILENHADMVNKAKASKKKTEPPPIKKESPVKETPKEPDPEYLYKDLNLTNEDMDQINDYKGFDPDTDDADFPEYYLHDTEPESTEIWSKYQAKKKFEPPAITKKGNTKPPETNEPPEIKKVDPAPPPISKNEFTIDKFQKTVGKVMRGEDISYNEVLETVKYVTDSKDKVIESLNKMTIKELKQISGSARMSDGKKSELVEEAYSDIISSVLNITGANKGDTETYTFDYGTTDNTIEKQKAKKIKAALENFTEDKHKENLIFRKEKHEKYLEEKAAKVERIKNPKTLEDFNFASNYRKFTPEERRTYEDLKAEKLQTKKVETKVKKEAAKIEGTTHYSSDKGGYSITLSKDTRDNRDLWIIKFDDKAGDFKELNKQMKSFSKGAGYSKFTRGFNFYEDPTDKLIEMYGSKLDVQEAPSKAEEIIKEKSDSRIEKLRSLADNMQSEIDKGYAERKENTNKRAREAANAREYAAKLEDQQKLIRKIADELEAGNIKFIGGITQKTQIEELDTLLNRSFRNYVSAAANEKYPVVKDKYGRDENSYKRSEYERSLTKQNKFTDEVPDHIKYPYPYNHKYSLTYLVDKTRNETGTKQAISRIEKFLEKQGPDAQKEYDTKPILNDIMKLHDILKTVDKSYKNAGMDTYKRLQAAGIETVEELRAALRELIMLKGDTSVSPEKLKEAEIRAREQELARSKIASYFPTPKNVVSDMLDRADIGEGERVLEPSAGAGHIADEIGPGKVDVVEFNMSLHNLLKDKGHNVVGQDFLEYNPGPVYDKIVMNPPFEKNADIIHIKHAWDLLKPGGRIVAITSEHPFFAKDKESTDFREFLDQYGIEYEKLPEGSFKEGDVKTGVNTRLVVIEKPDEIAPVKAAEPVIGDEIEYSNLTNGLNEDGVITKVNEDGTLEVKTELPIGDVTTTVKQSENGGYTEVKAAEPEVKAPDKKDKIKPPAIKKNTDPFRGLKPGESVNVKGNKAVIEKVDPESKTITYKVFDPVESRMKIYHMKSGNFIGQLEKSGDNIVKNTDISIDTRKSYKSMEDVPKWTYKNLLDYEMLIKKVNSTKYSKKLDKDIDTLKTVRLNTYVTEELQPGDKVVLFNLPNVLHEVIENDTKLNRVTMYMYQDNGKMKNIINYHDTGVTGDPKRWYKIGEQKTEIKPDELVKEKSALDKYQEENTEEYINAEIDKIRNYLSECRSTLRAGNELSQEQKIKLTKQFDYAMNKITNLTAKNTFGFKNNLKNIVEEIKSVKRDTPSSIKQVNPLTGKALENIPNKEDLKFGDTNNHLFDRKVPSKFNKDTTNVLLMVDGKEKLETVECISKGGLSIHASKSGVRGRVCVTHQRSGILISNFSSELKAKKFVNEALKRMDWDVDYEEIKKNATPNLPLIRKLMEIAEQSKPVYTDELMQMDKRYKDKPLYINLSLNAGRGINDRMRGVEYRGYERKSVKQARATVAPPPIKKVHQATFEEEIKRNPPKAVKVEPKDRFTAAKPDTSKVKPKIKTSKVKTNTWKNSEFMSDQWVQDVVTDVNADYLEKPNQESFEKAVNMLTKDYDGTVAKLMNITKPSRSTMKGKIPARAKMKNIFAENQPDIIPMTAEDVAASMIITRDLINSGDSEKLADFLGNFRPNVTNAGQVIQAMSMYKKLTPEGTLMRAAADVDKYFNDVVKDQPHKINDANKTASDIADKMKAVNTEVVDDVIKGVTDKLDDLITDPTGEVDTVIVTSPPPKPAAPETQAQPEPTKGPEELTPEQKQKVKDRLKPPPVGKKKPKTPKEPKTPKAAAGGPVVPPEEIPLEEKLAKRIKSYALSKPKRIEHDDKLLKSLFNVAKDEIDPMYMKQFTSPEEFVRHAIKFREQYNEIWVKAKEIISEEYKDNEEIGALFEDYFNKKLVPVFYEKDLNKAIKLKMKEKGLNLNQLVKQHYIYNKGAENYLVNTLTYGYDFTEEQANYLERYIRTEFKRLTAEKKEKILNDMFKEKGPIKRQETGPIKRIMELSNLGVYNNEKYAKMVYDKKGLPVLTPDDVLFINNKMLQYMTEKDPEMKEIWMGQIARRIGNKQASTTRSKALGLLRISLLGNAKTLLTKNAGGNIGLAIGENFKDYPATVIDYMISKRFDTLRTTAAPGLKTYKEQIFNLYDGLRRVIKDVKFDSDTNPARGRYEIPQGYSFQGKGPVNKVLGTLEKGVNIGLTAGDRPFYQAGRAAQLEQLKRLHGEELPDHMNDLAHDIGKERTYQNESTLNQSMKFIKTGMNKVLQFSPIRPGDIALTYTQTLSNIVDKKLDYTGIGGIIRGAAEFSSFARDIKNNTVMDEAEIMKRQKSIVDRFGRGIVGAAVFGAGIVGGLYGIVSGGEDKRDKIRDLEKSQGMQGNSVKIGKSYHSIDWIESIGTPLLLGADVAQKDKRGYSDYDLIVNAGENIISNDLFTGIKRLMGQYSDGLVDGMIKSVIELPSMFIPTTVKQIAQIVDGTSRDTKGENILETTKNKILNKIPYASKTLPPRVDIWGNDVKLYDGENNPLNVMLNPSYVSKEKENKAAMLTMAVFNERGNTDILPKYAPTTRTVTDIVKNKHQLVLTAEERIEWQRIIGQGVSKEFADLYDSSTFKILDQDKKEERMTEIITKWDNKALEKLCESRRIVLKPKK